MRQLWHHYYEEAAAIVFVLDAAQPDPAATASAQPDSATAAAQPDPAAAAAPQPAPAAAAAAAQSDSAAAAAAVPAAAAANEHAGQTPPSHPQQLQASVGSLPDTVYTSSTQPAAGEAAVTAAGAQQQESTVKTDGVSDAPAISEPASPSGDPEQQSMQQAVASAADGSAAAIGVPQCAAAADDHGPGAPSDSDIAVSGPSQAVPASEAESAEPRSQEPQSSDAKHHPEDPRNTLNSRAAPPLAEVLHSAVSHKHVQVSCSSPVCFTTVQLCCCLISCRLP